ncbi:MAG: glycosyltransferase family 2 protein [Deltaproteobacteria bacterium]
MTFKKQYNKKITVAICTFNRCNYLERCLSSLLEMGKIDYYNICVIDNNSNDDTLTILKKFKLKMNNLSYYHEKKIGLSHARNKALEMTKTQYIAFLDDDCFVTDTYLDRLFWLIENKDFDCLGGLFLPYYETKKPAWIGEDFGKMTLLRDNLGPIYEEYVAGGNIVFKKNIFQKTGFFPSNLGMKGRKTYYGEEDYIQKKIRENDGIILFDPDLVVFHIVQDYKLKFSWHIKSIILNSKTNFLINRKNDFFLKVFIDLIKSFFAAFLIRFPKCLYKFIFYKNYYFYNFLMDTFKPVLVNIGYLSGFFKHSFHSTFQ